MLRIAWKATCSHWPKLLEKWDSVWIRTYTHDRLYSTVMSNKSTRESELNVAGEALCKTEHEKSGVEKKKKQCSLSWWREERRSEESENQHKVYHDTMLVLKGLRAFNGQKSTMHLHCAAKLWKTPFRWATFTVKLLWCQSLKFSGNQPAIQLFQEQTFMFIWSV